MRTGATLHRALAASIWVWLLVAGGAAHANLADDYLQAYLNLNDAERLEKGGDYSGAVAGYLKCSEKLQQIHASDPHWENVLVTNRLEDCRAAIIRLSTLIAPASSATNGLATPATNNLPAYASLGYFALWSPPHDRTTNYSWKNGIATTIFWIPDKPQQSWSLVGPQDASAHDEIWNLNGYSSVNKVSPLNPFYVALPFDDLKHPDLAQHWVPSGWKLPAGPDGKPVSACLNRWVEIKATSGRVCFAQWEDVGPLRDDDPDYVFGSASPRSRAGLDVSPAVVKYLGLPHGGQMTTSWRFVDDADVRPGMWLRYSEQALLYQALRDQEKGK